MVDVCERLELISLITLYIRPCLFISLMAYSCSRLSIPSPQLLLFCLAKPQQLPLTLVHLNARLFPCSRRFEFSSEGKAERSMSMLLDLYSQLVEVSSANVTHRSRKDKERIAG